MQRPNAPLRLLYLPDMKETIKYIHVLGELMNIYLPDIANHFKKENVVASMLVIYNLSTSTKFMYIMY
jgi:hypothetical protein